MHMFLLYAYMQNVHRYICVFVYMTCTYLCLKIV